MIIHIVNTDSKGWQWRYMKSQIWKRDKGICQKCRNRWIEDREAYPIHHIYGNDDNNKPENLLLLCTKCHKKLVWNPCIEEMEKLVIEAQKREVSTKYCSYTNGICPKQGDCPFEEYRIEILKNIVELCSRCPVPCK